MEQESDECGDASDADDGRREGGGRAGTAVRFDRELGSAAVAAVAAVAVVAIGRFGAGLGIARGLGGRLPVGGLFVGGLFVGRLRVDAPVGRGSRRGGVRRVVVIPVVGGGGPGSGCPAGWG